MQREGVLSRLQENCTRKTAGRFLVVLQALDAAGKDGVIKHVMSGVNPQGCDVHAFKSPSNEELNHDYLWRTQKCIPERGKIGIFNRSYYEEVLVVRVHPTLLRAERLPDELITKHIWDQRYEDINAYEEYLTRNGVMNSKFFLHVSKEEQKKRFLERLEDPKKNWKFAMARRQRTRLLEGLPGSLRGDDPEYSGEARALVRGSCGQQVVYAADRGFRDYPGARRTPSHVPRCGQSKKERAGSRARFLASLRRIRPRGNGSAPPTIGLERATHPLPRPGVPLHHRTRNAAKWLPHSFLLCKISNHWQRNQLQAARRPLASLAILTIENYGVFIWKFSGTDWDSLYASKSTSIGSMSGISHCSNS